MLLLWGEMPSGTVYEKVPIYHRDTNSRDDIIMNIDVPFKTKTELFYTNPPALIA